MELKELSSLEQEELWVEGWEALYRLHNNGRKILINEQWQEISLDEAQVLIQDNAYESRTWNFEKVFFRGASAIRITFSPCEDPRPG